MPPIPHISKRPPIRISVGNDVYVISFGPYPLMLPKSQALALCRELVQLKHLAERPGAIASATLRYCTLEADGQISFDALNGRGSIPASYVPDLVLNLAYLETNGTIPTVKAWPN